MRTLRPCADTSTARSCDPSETTAEARGTAHVAAATFESGGHATAAGAQPREMPKKDQQGSCAPHVNAPTLATSHSRKHQSTILQSQQEVKRAPTQMKCRLQVEREPRNATVAVRTIGGRGRQRALPGEKQGSRTEMTHPTSTVDKAGFPQGRTSPHKEGRCQSSSYAPNGKSRSVSLARRQAAVPRPCAGSSQNLHQPSKPRSYHHSLKHSADNCAKRTTSKKRNEVPYFAPLPPPLARRYPGAKGQDCRHAPGRPVLRSPLTSFMLEDRTDPATDGNQPQAPLHAQSGIVPVNGQEVDTAFGGGSTFLTTTVDDPTSQFPPQDAGHFPAEGEERRRSPEAAATSILEAARSVEASCHSREISGMQLAQMNGPSRESVSRGSEAAAQATVAAPTTTERDGQHVLSKSNQPARTKMTHPMSTSENGGRQAGKSKPGAAASPNIDQQSKQRPYHHSLRRPADNSAKPTTSLKRIEALRSALLPPPVARKYPGVREHGPKQEPRQILRPPVLHSSLTPYTLECGPDQAGEVTYLAPDPQMSPGVMRSGRRGRPYRLGEQLNLLGNQNESLSE
ncbi:unnamed protein product [Rangifer tarandus platyrhynchus]|uniref:Uncharacterized protein n=1 Tax=Rangifer tarandus platyrhynchus TaxID=3082113 RepID=A0ABN8XIR7_RANTA|nr:unnamed protein product [Rangifer tarandus platyrhynchus]